TAHGGRGDQTSASCANSRTSFVTLQHSCVRRRRCADAMITWLEPSPALREFVRLYVYIHRTATAQHPVLPVLETRLAFYRRSACGIFDHRLQGIDTMARAAVIGPQTRHWVDLRPGRVEVLFALFQPGGFHRLFGGDSCAL